MELKAVRTQVIDLECSRRNMERKVEIMKDVIKMHEQRDATNTYKDTLTDTAMPSPACSQLQQSSRSQCHSWNHLFPPQCSWTSFPTITVISTIGATRMEEDFQLRILQNQVIPIQS